MSDQGNGQRRGRGRPSKGPRVAFTVRVPEPVAVALDEFQAEYGLDSRSDAVAALVAAGLESRGHLRRGPAVVPVREGLL